MGFGGADAFWDSPWDSPAPARSIGETADLFALLEGIPALRRPLTKRRWRRISESAPPELQHKWIEVVKPLLRHEHAVRPLLVAMWKQARLFGTVPAVGALEGRLDIDALARLYREKRAFWTYRPERPWHDVGPRARARAAAFDWEDGAWERSHFLAGPLFELIWEVMSEEEESSEAVEGIADQLDLAWWSAGGGTLDGAGVVFPWPAAELQTFSAQEYLAKQWNRAYQRARDFHEHTPEEERVADDLAFAYAEAHHVLWHRRADTASWTKDEHRWIQLVGHLRTVGEKDSSRCSRAMVRWTRAVPLLAAPESGLSQRSASAILEGAVLNDDLRRELRALRVARARLCMAGGDAEAMLDAFDAKHANHPWIERVEVEVGSRQTRDEDR